MTSAYVLTALVVLVLLTLLFFTALADSALRAINQVRLRSLLDQGVPRAAAVDRLLGHPHRITSTTLIVNTFVLAALAAITAILALTASPSEGSGRALVAAAVTALGLGVIVFFQLVPRSLAMRNPERTAVLLSRPLGALSTLVGPIAWMAERIANAFVRMLGVKDAPRNPYITEDDLQMLVNAGEQEGVIEEEEREMISGILRFGDTVVHEVMVPRPDVVAVSDELSPRQALDVALKAGHSRVPVYTENVDSIKGVLYTKDLISAVMTFRQRPLIEVARPAVFIPETKKLGELLHELRNARVHMAVVVDEYGGTAGIVTIEDLLEEIVGEIQDEYDVETPDIEQVADDEWIVNARIDLDDVSELLGLSLNGENYDSLGGFITAQLERLPAPGDVVRVNDVRMTVLDTERRRIGRVALKREPPEAGPEQASGEG
jgi:CBS domain containing-hemolysin-like protein